MTSLLTTAVDESCQSGLRGRRRSSVHPFVAVPRLFATVQGAGQQQHSSTDESAVSDDIELTPASYNAISSSNAGPTSILVPSPPLHVHMSDYVSKMTVPRHQNSNLSSFDCSSPSSPCVSSPQSSYPTTAVNSRKPSYDDINSDLSTLRRNDVALKGARGKTDSGKQFERMAWRLSAGYFAYFMCGWGDGITGTVLPMFMADFHMTFTTSSLLFMASTCGFFLGTFLVERILRVFSRARVNQDQSAWLPYLSRGDGVRYSELQCRHIAVLVSSILHGSFFVIMGTRGGFGVLFLAYVVAAFARAILSATLNSYFATVMPSSLGYGFGLWSFGGAISPLICQTVVAAGVPWFRFYFGSLVLAGMNTTFLVLAFRPTVREWLKESHEESNQTRETRNTDTEMASSSGDKAANTPQKSALRLALSLRFQWAFSLFSLIYCACETTTQGFMASYLLNTRHANPNTVGYVTSGLWGGITIGRFAWGYIMPSLSFTQRKYLIQGCTIFALILQLLIWFVNSNIGNTFSASIIGLFFGPIFPAALTFANALLPEEVHLVCMGLISAAGSLGSAIFPFFAGLILSDKGVHTLTYFTVPLTASVAIAWFFFPTRVPVGRM